MGEQATSEPLTARPGFGAVLQSRVFATVFGAEIQSIVGDQLARIALSVLVFDQTSSPAATASVYAVTYLPAIVGGIVLAGVGDRRPKRRVMVGADLARAGLFGVMALPVVPLPVVVGLLAVAVFLGPAFTSAEVSYLAQMLDSERFRTATGLRMMASQMSQVAGFAFGGLVVALVGARWALVLNAATFLGSALLIGVLLRTPRGRHGRGTPEPEPPPAVAPALRSGSLGGVGRVLRTPEIGRLLGLSALAGLFIVPEGLAVPFGDLAGASTGQIGLLLAAIPLGGVVGVVALVRLVPDSARRVTTRAMAVGCGIPLALTWLLPSWPLALGCWFVSGMLAAYQVDVLAAMMAAIAPDLRAHLVGVGTAVLLGAQGVGLIAFGAVAGWFDPAVAIGSAGIAGTLAALLLIGMGDHRRRAGAAPAGPSVPRPRPHG